MSVEVIVVMEFLRVEKEDFVIKYNDVVGFFWDYDDIFESL